MERNEVLLELNKLTLMAIEQLMTESRVAYGRRYQQALSIHTPDAGRALDPDGHLSDRRDGWIRTTVNRLLDIKERQLGQRP